MLFIDGPSVLAPVAEWLKYAEHLNTLSPHDETVISEKSRTQAIIALLREEAALVEAAAAARART